MKKLVLAAMMALGLGLAVGSAHAATMQNTYSNHPQVTHWGPDYGNDSGYSE
jgi:hypothetical protein